MSESMGQLIAVPFRDDTLWATKSAGDILVAVRPIAERLGLDWRSQLRRLRSDEVLAASVVIMTTETPAGPRETICIPADLIFGWLMGVKVKKVKPEIRAKIHAYRKECYRVLWKYFMGAIDAPIPDERPSAAGVHKGIEASLHPHQLRVLVAVAAYGETDTAAMIAACGLSAGSVKRSIFLLWYLGVVDAYYDERGIVRHRVIPAEKRPYLPFPAGPQRAPRLAGRSRPRG